MWKGAFDQGLEGQMRCQHSEMRTKGKPVQAKRQGQEFNRNIWGTVTNLLFLKWKVSEGGGVRRGYKAGMVDFWHMSS